ncbi:inositol monophosphatase 1-like [Oppia nitens]|uniref:inositol monophosphatase 1-like n=1 Tax=Oppia nitens TaxID=1686743 RepID=UPI0023D9A173|nr:inositol monophosphatase 1-like [Oppia nitens]
MNTETLLVCERVAIELAIAAGRMMSDAAGKRKEVREKESAIDLVTETDIAVERYLFGELRRQFPAHRFIGEEGTNGDGGGGQQSLTAEPTWIVDPIDGTTNFVHNFPFTCVSIGLTVGKEPVLGVVYCPFIDKLYTARKGMGATCNGRPIRVPPLSASRRLADALLITELGSHKDLDKQQAVLRNIEAIGWRSHGVRSFGSTAIQLCYLAEGYGDAFWHFGMHVWDIVAAGLVLIEAGGVVWDTRGGPINWLNRRVLAATSEQLAREVSAALTDHLEYEPDK